MFSLQVKRISFSFPYVITHLEYLTILSMMVLETSNYWIHLGGGSQFLPTKWVHLSTTIIDHSYQVFNILYFNILYFYYYINICLYFRPCWFSLDLLAHY